MLAFYLSLLETDEDRALFEFYFHQHEQNVLKIVMKILHNQAMAEDAVQSGWENLIKNFEKFVQISVQERDGFIVGNKSAIWYNSTYPFIAIIPYLSPQRLFFGTLHNLS